LAKAYKKRVLGRGLSAILNEDDNNRFRENINSKINEIDINHISLNPDQPRTNFNENSLKQLTSSINELGLIQPITVKEKDGKYILISGER
jgi:ParB family chromosome partitioning protein